MQNSITVIIPVYSGETTLKPLFDSLEQQLNKDFVSEIIIINDNSPDNSQAIIEDYKKVSNYKIRGIFHEKSIGLANNYNKGIDLCETKYFLLVHQDMVLPVNNAFETVLTPFQADKNVVASYPTLIHPFDVWQTYSYWQKCLFSRFVNRKIPDLTGKFDCFDKEVLISKVGKFDNIKHRTAGEDGDIKIRIKNAGLFTKPSGLEVIHLHSQEKNFTLAKWIKKECQLGEAHGTLLRKYGITNLKDFLIVYFRPILITSLLIPYFNILVLAVILLYSILYTRLVLTNVKDLKNLILPFVNIYLLFASSFFTFKGFITGKQTV